MGCSKRARKCPWKLFKYEVFLQCGVCECLGILSCGMFLVCRIENAVGVVMRRVGYHGK